MAATFPVGTKLIAAHALEVVIHDEPGEQHQDESTHREPQARHEHQEQDEARQEPGQSPPDPPEGVGGHRGLGHRLHEAGVLLRQLPLDLLEDALLVRCQRHRILPWNPAAIIGMASSLLYPHLSHAPRSDPTAPLVTPFLARTFP